MRSPSELARASSNESSSPSHLVQRYVDEILMARNLDSVRELFAPTYRDHDPIRVPGVWLPSAALGTVRDVESLVAFLRRSEVNINFVLEETISEDDRVAYRIFGHGFVQVTRQSKSSQLVISADQGPRPSPRHSIDQPRGFFGVMGTRVSLSEDGWPEGKVLANQLSITYSCVGVFRTAAGRFCERWGPEILA